MIRRSDTPIEVLLSALIAGAGGLTFVLVALVRWQIEGGADLLRAPIFIALIELLVAAGIMFRLRVAHVSGMVLFLIVALLHLLFVLADIPVWARIVSGVLSALHVYGVVLLNTGPARAYLGGPR
ncbi:hypothetical protein Lesp02_18750 [Lentzea sp. NBRC 105346]|uniref:hypothetical protein n=1 Tax=Lentzea sp. NBRC 105346 TaxID=3032205 RepID=UPI0024A5235F|nr:hypothetical protein [Lentzea sp. NBRC 105346]GLZ29685.1 hypothetical protein Lesp02_18750 [Lentzea sp. NBRC 105346]